MKASKIFQASLRNLKNCVHNFDDRSLFDFTFAVQYAIFHISFHLSKDCYEGFTVVSIQVYSIQIEVVSRHHRSRFDTRRKSIRFNSIFRPVAGGGIQGELESARNFQIWIKFRYKSGILLTRMDSCQWKLQFPSILDNRQLMYFCSSVQFGIV